MNISGIRPISDYSKTFGAYDVSKLMKPTVSNVSVGKTAMIHSQAQVEKAVDVAKRDSSLAKYNRFIGVSADTTTVPRPELENFNL